MIMLYFSGTGNSKYIAKLFCHKMQAKSYSIEDSVDFEKLINNEDTVGFCYPVYGSRVPRIMREFIFKHMKLFKNKKVIIFCTQALFSGDGARVLTDLFPHNYIKVIYAEHFFMPNNICNFFLLPAGSKKQIEKQKIKARRKMKKVCHNITDGVIKKRGFNHISKTLGLIQGAFMPKAEEKARNDVWIDASCTKCQLCTTCCPMDNIKLINGEIKPQGNCTMCYRCINKCPQKAIRGVLPSGRIGKQYKGM